MDTLVGIAAIGCALCIAALFFVPGSATCALPGALILGITAIGASILVKLAGGGEHHGG